MIVYVKKRNNEEMYYVSDLGLLDLTSMLGHLFASGAIKDWRIEEFEVKELFRPRTDWLLKLEKRYVRNGKVLRDSFINANS